MDRWQPRGRVAAMVCAGLAAWLAAPRAADRSAAAMAEAAGRLLAGLAPEQRRLAALPFDSPERERWGYDPTELFQRQGLPLEELSEPQRRLAHDLLESGLSERGYLAATAVMERETIILALEKAGGGSETRPPARRLVHDPLRYYVAIFGTPSAEGAWGWRVEGHHLSLNFTIVGGSQVASTPTFFGAFPAEVGDGPREKRRFLAGEEDRGRALLTALDAGQRAKAAIARTAPNDISTTVKTIVTPLPPVGVAASEMSPEQRELLMRLLAVYTSAMPADIAADRMARLQEAGLDRIIFSWAGEAEPRRPHYYRVLGPTFVIEYANAQDDANHIHSVWRDFEGDFGRDLVRGRAPATR